MRWFAIVLLLTALTACVPGASVVAPPTFQVVADDTRLVRLEPPGVGSGAAVVRIALNATNPNPIPIEIAGLDAAFVLAGRNVAQSRFPDGVALAANGTSRWTVEVEVPLAEAPHVAEQMARLVTGSPVAYRLDGTLTLDVFGTRQRLPSVTLAQGELGPLGPLALPEVRFDPSASSVRLEGLSVVVDAALAIRNPSLFGYRVEGPSLLVLLDGRPVGSASVPPAAVPAFGEATVVFRAQASVVDLGTVIATQIQGGGALEVAVDGALEFVLPGIGRASLGLERIGATLR